MRAHISAISDGVSSEVATLAIWEPSVRMSSTFVGPNMSEECSSLEVVRNEGVATNGAKSVVKNLGSMCSTQGAAALGAKAVVAALGLQQKTGTSGKSVAAIGDINNVFKLVHLVLQNVSANFEVNPSASEHAAKEMAESVIAQLSTGTLEGLAKQAGMESKMVDQSFTKVLIDQLISLFRPAVSSVIGHLVTVGPGPRSHAPVVERFVFSYSKVVSIGFAAVVLFYLREGMRGPTRERIEESGPEGRLDMPHPRDHGEAKCERAGFFTQFANLIGLQQTPTSADDASPTTPPSNTSSSETPAEAAPARQILPLRKLEAQFWLKQHCDDDYAEPLRFRRLLSVCDSSHPALDCGLWLRIDKETQLGHR